MLEEQLKLIAFPHIENGNAFITLKTFSRRYDHNKQKTKKTIFFLPK